MELQSRVMRQHGVGRQPGGDQVRIDGKRRRVGSWRDHRIQPSAHAHEPPYPHVVREERFPACGCRHCRATRGGRPTHPW